MADAGANVATLVSVLLVLMQLQQNRDLMRAQVRHDLLEGIVELLNGSAGNVQLALPSSTRCFPHESAREALRR